MKDFLAVVLTCSILCTSLLSGCAGRQANPAQAYQPGDDKRSCEGLKTEYSANENQIKCLKKEEDGKFWWNTTCLITGCLIIIPWFLMDVKDTQKIETNALKQRNANLMIIASDRSCDLSGAATAGQ